MNIAIEQPHHAAAIDTLLDLSFGPERAGKTVYRLREGVDPVPGLSLVALEDDAVVGTIRYWPVLIGGVTPTILLGPWRLPAISVRDLLAPYLPEEFVRLIPVDWLLPVGLPR